MDLIIVGIIGIGIIIIGIKINSNLNKVPNALKSEHKLNKPYLNILLDSISPNQKYQFNKGRYGNSRIFWSVIENNESNNDLEKGLIPSGYKIVEWNNKSELILEKQKPPYESNTTCKLNNKTEYNEIKINIAE